MYKIKITTFSNGRKEYVAFARKKILFFIPSWSSLDCDGKEYFSMDVSTDSRDKALARIDKHFSGNTTVQSIQFEYINKDMK